MIGWWVMLACSRPDPELVARREAATLADEGEAKLAAGDLEGARAAFRAARAKHDAPLLLAWEAAVEAQGGDLEAAVDRMADALEGAPQMAEARYNRAAWLVKLGRLDAAGPELQRALAQGVAEPLEVLDDSDFAAALGHAAFAFLPEVGLVASVKAPEPVAFLGGEVTVAVRVEGLVPKGYEVVPERVVGPAVLVRAVENRVSARQVDLSWTLRAVGAGELELGPFMVRAGERTAQAHAIRVQVSAPPGHRPAESRPPWLPVPSGLLGEIGARVVDNRVVVQTAALDRAVLPSSMGRPARLEVQHAGVPQAVLHVVPAPQELPEVVVEEADGTERWRGTPARG